MVEGYSRKSGRQSTSVDRRCIKLSSDTYDELSRLKEALDVKSFDRLVRRLMESSEVDPLKVADQRIAQLEEEVGGLVPHAYGAVSQALVLARAALRLDETRCEALQMELLSVLRQMRREEGE